MSLLLLIICADVYLLVAKPWAKKEIIEEPKREIIIPLNYKISNAMSCFDETEKFDKTVTKFLSKWEIEGATFAIMKDGQLLYAKGYGYADKQNKVECDVKHLFRVASVSKLITGATIMKLKEEGKITLEDCVFGENGILNDSIFMDIRDKRVKEITIEHLLRHETGFSRRVGDPMFTPDVVANTLGVAQPLTMDNFVEYAAESILYCTPGSATQYSNLGYLVLTKVIEEITGENYESYVQKNIFHPLGCYDAHIGRNVSSQKYPNEVLYYEVHDAEPIESYDGTKRELMRSNGGNDITGLYGAGAWIISSVELLKFVSAIDNNPSDIKLLSPESTEYMTRYYEKKNPIGWAGITEEDQWVRSGSFSGTSALIKHENDGYTWTLVTNTSSWKGSAFSSIINKEITQAIRDVEDSWPERDLFVSQPEVALDTMAILRINNNLSVI